MMMHGMPHVMSPSRLARRNSCSTTALVGRRLLACPCRALLVWGAQHQAGAAAAAAE